MCIPLASAIFAPWGKILCIRLSSNKSQIAHSQDRPATLLSAGHQVNKSQLESFNCIFNRTANFATFFQHFPWKHYFSWILKFASVLFGERNDCAENLFTVEETCWNSQDRKKCQWKLSLLSFRSVPPFVQNHKNSSKILFWENKSEKSTIAAAAAKGPEHVKKKICSKTWSHFQFLDQV